MPNRKSRILLPFLLLMTILIITATSCNMFNEPEGGNGGSLTLTVEDVSCTEAWIKLSASGTELPASVKLYANDTLKQTLELTTADTLIYDEGLLPNRAYAYRAELIKPQKPTVKSKTVTATTLDTTSHDFTWETFTFGGANGSSYLRDVAIINENDIWAVGEIHTSWTDQWDSNGVWVQPYNAVHWNGQEWELRRVMWDNSVSRLTCVFAFSSDDVWFGVTNLIHWNGDEFVKNWNPVLNDFADKTVNAIWGTSSSDLYIVGNEGKIAHYDGSGWEKIESGTETQIRDIWGYNDKVTEMQKVLCAVSNVITLGDNKILEINKDNTITEVPWNTGDADKRVNSIWFNDNHRIFTCGGGVFIGSSKGLWKKQNLPSIHTNKIRGNEKNDVFVAGDFGLLAHFNGVDWKVYNTGNVALFYSLSYRNNILTAVGERNGKAVILKMKKQ